jgi:predicted PurR-regulated permease PerM
MSPGRTAKRAVRNATRPSAVADQPSHDPEATIGVGHPVTADRATLDDAQAGLTVVRVEIATKTVLQIVAVVLLTLGLLRAATAARTLLALIGLSFFFSLALDPAVRWLATRYGWRRGAAVGLIYVVGVVFVSLFAFGLVPAIGTLAQAISDNAGSWLRELDTWTQEVLGVSVTSETIATELTGAGETLREFSQQAFTGAIGIASAGVTLLFNLAAIALFTFYFTAEAPKVKQGVLRLFGPKTQGRIGWTWDQAIVQTGGYFYSRLILMAINGVGFFTTMALVGLPVALAFPLAVFGGFVSAFIPAIGSYLGAAVPVLITLAVQGPVAGLVVLVYAVVYQQIENYWLGPKISAGTMSLSGGVAFGAALAGGAIGGPVGAFVALPIAALVSSTIANYARSYEVVYHSALDTDRTPPPTDRTPPPEEPKPTARPTDESPNATSS